MKGKKILSTALALVLMLSMLPAAGAAQTGLSNFKNVNTYTNQTFRDVAAGSWYSENVKSAYEMDLMKDTSAKAFSPNANVTVGSAIALACRLHSIYHTGKADFTQGSPWYQVYVDYAVKNKIITAGQFKNYNANATRRQFAAILASALPAEALTGKNSILDGSIPDVAMTDDSAADIYALYRAGVLTGNDALGTFAPESTIDRASVSAIISRMADPALRKTLALEKPITLDDLQGVWYHVSYTEMGDIETEVEYVFEGNTFTYARRYYMDSRYGHYTLYCLDKGTITQVMPNYTNKYGNVRDLAFAWDGHHVENVNPTDFYPKDIQGDRVIELDDIDLAGGTMENSFDMGGTLTKVSAPRITQEVIAAVPMDPSETSVYDFIVGTVQREGRLENYGERKGQYRIFLDLFGQVTSQYWNYLLYYDPATGALTIEGSTSDSYGDNPFGMSAGYSETNTLVLDAGLTGPYAGTLENTTYVGMDFEETKGTVSLKPSAFTGGNAKFTTFTTDGTKTQAEWESSYSAFVKQALLALEQDILKPNGYKLSQLGFTNF